MSKAAEADAWLKANRVMGGLSTGFSTSKFKELSVFLGDLHCFELLQQAGDRVDVPVGWLHTVENLRPCLKVARNVYDTSTFPASVVAWRLAFSKFVYMNQGVDHMKPLIVACFEAVANAREAFMPPLDMVRLLSHVRGPWLLEKHTFNHGQTYMLRLNPLMPQSRDPAGL